MNEPLRYADIEPGYSFTTPGIRVTEAHVVQFAGLSGDFFELHMDERFAQSLGFPGRVAHGLLCLALVDGLKNRATTRFAAIASLEWTCRFLRPILIGDRLEAQITVLDKRPTRALGRGIVRLQLDVQQQDGERVQTGGNTLMVSD